VGPGIGLVLSGQPYPTSWLPPQERSDGVLVRWNFAEDEESIIRTIRNVAKKRWQGPAVQINVTGDALVLFDAAMPGYDILTPFLRIPMESATYEVRAVTVAPDRQTSLVLHPFTKVE
jgi:hypothetical protein